MKMFEPSPRDMKEIKSRCIDWISHRTNATRAQRRALKRLPTDSILDALFQRADGVTMTLSDGRRVLIRNGEVMQ